jgi:uncharacterized integral membrane protein
VAEPQTPQPTERQGWNWKAILLAALGIYAVLLIVLNRKTVSVDFVVFTEKTRVIWLVLLASPSGADHLARSAAAATEQEARKSSERTDERTRHRRRAGR